MWLVPFQMFPPVHSDTYIISELFVFTIGSIESYHVLCVRSLFICEYKIIVEREGVANFRNMLYSTHRILLVEKGGAVCR